MRPSATPLKQHKQRGQAIIETVLALPLLFLIVFATFLGGASLFSGYRAANAMRTPTLQRDLLANGAAVDAGTLQGLVNALPGGSFTHSALGANIDALTLSGTGNVTAFMVGQKTFNTNSPYFPSIRYRVSQGVDARLLEANTGTALPFNTVAPAGVNLVSPTAFGFASVTTPLEIDDACTGNGPLQVSDVVTGVLPTVYELLEFAAPTTPPPFGAIPPLATTAHEQYGSPATLTALLTQPNTACEETATQTAWVTACTTEFATATTTAALPDYILACTKAKTASCKAYYANAYLYTATQQLNSISACQASTPGNDVTFPTGQPHAY
jgi:TadE-like protein